ncbi:septum formation initiator family protein [Candidatus Margulisiibacteriota bacterium]
MKIKLISPFSAFLTFLIVIYVTSIGIKNIFRYNVFKFEYNQLIREWQTEKKNNFQMQKQISDMNFHSYWDFEIRKKLGYISKGEKVYKFIDVKTKKYD